MKIRQALANLILKGVELEQIKVKHLDITGKNTLTTPKVVLTDSAANPSVNGEIQRNGTSVKTMSEGVVKKLGTDGAAQIIVDGKSDTLENWVLL